MKKFLIILSFVSFQILAQDNEQSFYTFKQQVAENILNDETAKPNFEFDDVKKKKSNGLAILYSMILPGMGELYAGSYDSGIYFTIADGVLWGTYVGMNVYGTGKKIDT